MQSWGRWLSRALVVGGLVGLVVVAYHYGSFVTVFGDAPCERDPARCDDRSNLFAQRELGRWFLAAGALLTLGVVATAARRLRAPRAGEAAGEGVVSEPRPVVSIFHVALAAFARGAGSFGLVLLTVIFWLFGGTAVYLAVGLTWLVVLTWWLDRSHRRRLPGDGDLGSSLVSGASAATGIVVGCTAAVALVPIASPSSASAMFLLVPLVIALGTGTGAAAVVVGEQLLARRLTRHGTKPTAEPSSKVAAKPAAPAVTAPAVTAPAVTAPAVTAPAVTATSVVLVGLLLVVGTPVGRDLVSGVRSDLHPDLAPAVASSPSPVLPDPRPDLTFTEPPDPKPSPTPTVVAARPCTHDDLTLRAQGWDSAMGSSATAVVATNRSATACWVRGYPSLRLEQGGTDLSLSVARSPTQRFGGGDVVPDRRIGLAARGGQASFDLWWRGYRQAADQRTPQTLVVTPSRTEPLRLRLTAPYLFDLAQDAEVTVMRWTVPSLGSG